MKTLILSTAMAALLTAGPALAQTNTGTTIGSFLEIEPNARIAAMGNAGVSAYTGLEGVYYNPASIGSAKGYELLFAHTAWFADITYDYAAVSLPAGSWGQAYVTVTSLNSGDMDVRTVDQPLGTGERFRANDLAVALGFGRQLSPRFSAGVQLNFAQETIWHTSAGFMTVSLGTLYRVSENGLRIGSSLSNFGTRAAYDGRDLRFSYDNVPGQNGDNSALPASRFTDQFSVPLMFRVGVALPVRMRDTDRLLLAADAFHPNDNSESVSMGAEYFMKGVLAVRAGWQNLGLQDSEVGLTLGAGVKGSVADYRYRVDYAWADEGRLGHANRLSVDVTF